MITLLLCKQPWGIWVIFESTMNSCQQITSLYTCLFYYSYSLVIVYKMFAGHYVGSVINSTRNCPLIMWLGTLVYIHLYKGIDHFEQVVGFLLPCIISLAQREPLGLIRSCSAVGLKPTWGLVPHTGAIGLAYSFDHVGPMATNVHDCALLLEVSR